MEHLSMIWACCYHIWYCVCVSASGSSVVLCWWQLGFDLRVKWPLWSRRPAAPACHRGHQWDRQLQHWGNPTNGNTIERLLFFCVKLCSFAQLSCLWKPEKLLVTGSCSSPPPLHSASCFVCEMFSGGNWSNAGDKPSGSLTFYNSIVS